MSFERGLLCEIVEKDCACVLGEVGGKAFKGEESLGGFSCVGGKEGLKDVVIEVLKEKWLALSPRCTLTR